VVTVIVFDNPIQPVPPTVTCAWKVDPELEEIVVVATGPVIPYPNHSTVVPAGYPDEYVPVSATEMLIAFGEQRVVSEIESLGPIFVTVTDLLADDVHP
jgi:hypothetical protein